MSEWGTAFFYPLRSFRLRQSRFRGNLKKIGRITVFSAAVILADPVQAEKITIACAAVGIEYQLCREGSQAWAIQTGHKVQLVQTPASATERLALFQQLLSSQSSDIDVFQIDVIWPGLLGTFFIDLNQYFSPEELELHFNSMIVRFKVDDELKAIPWYADVGLLYYRKDLLKKHGRDIPGTWTELVEAARAIVKSESKSSRSRLVGLVFQGKAYEGLTCNALEWLAAYGAEQFLKPDGTVDLENTRAIEALRAAASWIGDVAPRGVLNYAEEEARGVFQSGNAVFMRNWPYAWALVNGKNSPVKDKVGIAPLPQGGNNGKGRGTLGGGGLAVSIYSKKQKLAADLVRFLTSKKEQIRRAINGSINPTLPSAYEDQRLLVLRPAMRKFLPMLNAGVGRPAQLAGDKYNHVSAIFWNAIHDTLTGRLNAQNSLADAQKNIDRLMRQR